MFRTGLGWTAVRVAVFIGTATLVCVAVRAEDDGEGNTPEPTPQTTVKLISLKFRDPQLVYNVLMPLGLVMSPDVQTNRLLVIARPGEIKQVEELVRELDVPIERTKDQPQLELKLYRLRHRQPSELMECVVPMLSDRGRISADPGSRTLFVKDEPTVHTDVATIIREIDAPPGETVALKSVHEKADPASDQYPPDDVQYSTPVLDLPAAKEQRTIKLRARVCAINRAAASGLDDDSSPMLDNPLVCVIRGGSPVHATFGAGDVETGVAELADRGVLKVVCEPSIAMLSGTTATFVSCIDEFEGPVVIEEDSLTEATIRVAGLAVDLKLIATVLEAGLIRLQMCAPFMPAVDEMAGAETGAADRSAETPSVELKHGEVFASSGKITVSKPPEPGRGGLGAVSVLGQLFRAKRSVTQETELIIFVTAEAVELTEPEKLAREADMGEPKSR